MFVLANFLGGLAYVVDAILFLLWWLIFFRVIISWVNPDPFNPIVQFLRRVTDPVLSPIQRLMPPMPIDISPIIAAILIGFLRNFLVSSLNDWAMSLR